MTRTKKIGLSLAGIIVIGVGIAYYYNPWPHTSLDPRFHPHLNPNPKKFLTIYGHVDRGLKVRLTSSFFTSNPKCNHITALMQGSKNPYATSYPIFLKPNSQGNYKTKIPIDKLSPGFCKWDITSISYMGIMKDKGDGQSGLIFFDKGKNKYVKNNKLTINCAYYPKDKYKIFACKLPPTSFDYLINPSSPKKTRIDFSFKIVS